MFSAERTVVVATHHLPERLFDEGVYPALNLVVRE